jgi:hypothetical protein
VGTLLLLLPVLPITEASVFARAASRNVSDSRMLELFSRGVETQRIDTRLPAG